MSDNNPVKEEVQKFDKRCLKKTNTAEKNTLPTQEGKRVWQPRPHDSLFQITAHPCTVLCRSDMAKQTLQEYTHRGILLR